MSADSISSSTPSSSGPSGAESPGRRAFLERAFTGVLTGVLAAGSPLALFAPSRVWALDLKSFNSTQGTILMAAARTIAPHDHLEDAAYALVVGALDTAATQDAALHQQLTAGLTQLGEGFVHSPEAARVAALKALESTPFFQSVRTYTLRVLYATPMAFKAFGYEGEAFSKGGYLGRGFNDLRWLPDVAAADSGPVGGA